MLLPFVESVFFPMRTASRRTKEPLKVRDLALAAFRDQVLYPRLDAIKGKKINLRIRFAAITKLSDFPS